MFNIIIITQFMILNSNSCTSDWNMSILRLVSVFLILKYKLLH
jgi:hypothetical protein